MSRFGKEAFSLVELLVALVFLGLLLGGLSQVYVQGLKTCARLHDGLRAQRSLRLAMARLSEDLQMAGFFYPPPELRSLPWEAGGGVGRLRPFLLLPSRPISRLLDGAFVPATLADDPYEPGPWTADEVSLVMDLPLQVPATLASGLPQAEGEVGPKPSEAPSAPSESPPEPVTMAAPTWVWVKVKRRAALEPGDLLLLREARFEWAVVQEAVVLRPRGAVAVPVRPVRDASRPSAWGAAHAAGSRVAFIRPLRVVRYAVVYLSLDGPRALTPCLVRFETAYPPGGAQPRWAGLLTQPRTLAGTVEVVAEHVTGLRLDLALGGGFPGIRGPDEATTAANLAEALRGQGTEGSGLSPDDPLWFRKAAGTLQITLATRSPHPRPEYAVPGGARPCGFLHRTQTWLLTPMNFGLERPP